jgi:hypothetical protein
MATPASGVDTWLTLNGVPLSFKRGDENLAANAAERTYNALRITSYAPDGIEIRFDGELLETEIYGRWTWNPRGFAGLYDLEVRVPGGRSYHALVRVLPSLLSFERYKKMLADISQIAADLAIQIQGPASEKAVPRTRKRPHSAMREYELVRRLMHDMAAVMAAIGRSPHKALRERSETRLAHEVRAFSGSCSPIFGSGLQLPDAVSETIAIEELPSEWWVQESVLTYDVYENRLLKHFLWRQLLIRIDSIQERATREIERRRTDLDIIRRNGWDDTETDVIQKLESVVEECRREAQACMAWGSEPFLRSVGAIGLASRPTQVLQKHPHYGRFYQLYLHFQRSLTLNLETESYLATFAVRKMSELYETWAIFQMTYVIMNLLLKSGYILTSSNGWFGFREDWFHLEVDRDADIKLSKEGVQVRIRYEPLYSPLNKVVTGMVVDGPYQLTPDMTVEVWQDDLVTEVIVFDAKYKTELVAGEQKYLEKDLETMDHYARRICWKSGKPNARPRRVVTSAYILYPGDVLAHDPERPEVGALSMTPDSPQTKHLVAATRSILKYSQLL